eukprot:GHVU01022026.1.p1 GENE.GHVU01022026.1~~GHVU01022026.1.p1  ORF type:complete len:172 (+),score=40.17 GHVU01022026.1:98-613(+)
MILIDGSNLARQCPVNNRNNFLCAYIAAAVKFFLQRGFTSVFAVVRSVHMLEADRVEEQSASAGPMDGQAKRPRRPSTLFYDDLSILKKLEREDRLIVLPQASDGSEMDDDYQILSLARDERAAVISNDKYREYGKAFDFHELCVVPCWFEEGEMKLNKDKEKLLEESYKD